MKLKGIVLFLLATLFLSEAFSSEDTSRVIRINGATQAPGGILYLSTEAVGVDGKGVDWQLLRETADPQTGKVSTELVFRSGEREVFGYPLNAFWSVNAGKTFFRTIPATDEHPAWTENQTIIVFACSGWGGEKPGSANGICKYLPESDEVTGVISDADTATYAVPGGNSAQVFRIGNFQSPIVSERDQYGTLGIVFTYADCSDGTKVTRCFIGIDSQKESEARVVFLNGTGDWSFKRVEIDRVMVVEELPRVAGWSAQLKVVKDQIERVAIVTVLLNGEVVFHVTGYPWIPIPQ